MVFGEAFEQINTIMSNGVGGGQRSSESTHPAF